MNTSRFILGTVQFGMAYGINNVSGKPDKEKVFDILHSAYDHSVYQIDSADLYGDAQMIIGDFIKSTRKNFLVNTKFLVHSELSIQDQLTKTLKELSLEKANVYFYHRFQEMQNNPHALNVLNGLKQKKLINKIGVSVYTNEEFQVCIENEAVDVIQLPFNLLDNYSKRGKLVERAKDYRKEIQIRSVFLQGLFFKEVNDFPQAIQPLSKYVNQLQQLGLKYGISMQDLALRYALSKEAIDYIIIGVDSKEQLLNNIATQQGLDKGIEQEIDKIMVLEEPLLYPYNWK
jgi:aryl-alcohol dehydrogenase-like predicted oxidoreductase